MSTLITVLKMPTIGLLAIILVALIFQRVMIQLDTVRYPATGELVDVGGHRLHFRVMGTQNNLPTVVLEAGNGGFSSQWIRVQTALAEHTQVVSYDRAGFGWSDTDTQARDLARNAEQLHAGLEQLGIEPPYILVGHSMGVRLH